MTGNSIKIKYLIDANKISIDESVKFMISNMIMFENMIPEVFCLLIDLVWTLNFTLSQVWTENIKKIRKRHGESYNPKHYKK